MKSYFFLLIALLSVSACLNDKSKQKTSYPSKGSLLVYDTASGKYIVSSSDKKLVSAWESFKDALIKSDFNSLITMSLDSIICEPCASSEENSTTKSYAFYNQYAKSLFKKDFIASIKDDSKIRCSYDYQNSYVTAYSFLADISKSTNPKIAEINVSFPLPNDEPEGLTVILSFIEIKGEYKFFSYSTIP